MAWIGTMGLSRAALVALGALAIAAACSSSKHKFVDTNDNHAGTSGDGGEIAVGSGDSGKRNGTGGDVAPRAGRDGGITE